jgi:hypothetical protein
LRHNAPQCAPQQTAGDKRKRLIQPDNGIGALPDAVAHAGVISATRPTLAGDGVEHALPEYFRGSCVQLGSQCSASNSMCGTRMRSASCCASVLLPEPVEPTTTMRFHAALHDSRKRSRIRYSLCNSSTQSSSSAAAGRSP